MSEVKRYSFWPQIVHLPGGGGVRAEVHFKVEEDGLFVAHQDYARLKAEVERLRASSFVTAVPVEEYEKLKAEVERLTDCQSEADRLKAEVEAHEKRWAESEDLISHYKQQRDEAYNDCQCHRLKAENERLRKAGDMCDQLLACFEMEGRRGVNIGRDMWRAAKEGKQP